jgi:hypothetical protein
VKTIEVPSLDEFAQSVGAKEAEGKLVSPRTSIPGVGYFSYCLENEGNSFGIIENDISGSIHRIGKIGQSSGKL